MQVMVLLWLWLCARAWCGLRMACEAVREVDNCIPACAAHGAEVATRCSLIWAIRVMDEPHSLHVTC